MQMQATDHNKTSVSSDTKRIIVWSVYRSRSTALERAFDAREDTTAYWEIFIPVFFKTDDSTYDSILEKLLGPCETPFLFTKKISIYMTPSKNKEMTVETMKNF